MSPLKPAQVPAAPEPLARVSYAQSMEDILLDRIFRGRTGSYLDVGANHPFLESNTYFFYLRGWRGVNLEPIPRNHAMFLEHRPDDLNLRVAASDTDGELTFHEIATAEGLTGHSSVSDEVAEQHRAQGFAVSSYPVPARTLGSLIAEHAIAPPDLLSIDVESHEDAVIRGIPWATWRPAVLVIESLLPLSHVASHASWEPILLEHGYLFAATNGINRFYLRDDLADRLELLQTPVNCLDQYQRADEVQLRAEAAELYNRLQDLHRQYDTLAADREWDRSNFDRIRAGWEWGQAQAELAKQSWDRELAAFAWHRANFERAQEVWEQERSVWDRERAERQQEQAAWDQQRARWEQDGAEWVRKYAEFERHWAAWQWERAALAHECDALARERDALAQQRDTLMQELESLERDRASLHGQLAATQRVLRPYRLLDRLGVVTASYGVARRVKHRIGS